jgi:hypothetical protein
VSSAGAPEAGALSCPQYKNGELLDLRARTGVRTNEPPTSFDHEDRSRSWTNEPLDCQAAFRPTSAATNDNVGVDIISYAFGERALGRVLIARSVSGVGAILIGDDDDELEADLAARCPQAELVANEASSMMTWRR